MDFGTLVVPLAGIAFVGSFVALVAMLAKNYIKVPPNRVAIFFGRWRETPQGERVGFRVITGGARFKLPFFESVTYLELNMFAIPLEVHGAPNKDGVLINAKGVANVKVLNDEPSLMAAAERFLGKTSQEIYDIAYKSLEGHLRAIIGRLSVEEIVSDRNRFNQEVLGEAGQDLKRIGLGVDILTIQEIDDEHGYIKALGKRRTAEVMRDASIGEADAQRDAKIRSTTAQREAEQTARANDALIAEAEKERDVKKAQFLAVVEAEKAKATQAGLLAAAQAQQQVVLAQVAVATQEADRKEKELLASVVRPAEAEKLAAIAEAEGKREATIKAAEAEKEAARLRGEGEAAAIQARGQAEAEIIKAKLLAEAEGVLKKAEAYERLGQTGQMLQLVEQLQTLIPNALEKLGPVMAEIAKPLGSVDRISLVDFGGNGENVGSVGRFAQTVPLVLTQLLESFRSMGLDPTELMHMLKVREEQEVLALEPVSNGPAK